MEYILYELGSVWHQEYLGKIREMGLVNGYITCQSIKKKKLVFGKFIIFEKFKKLLKIFYFL